MNDFNQLENSALNLPTLDQYYDRFQFEDMDIIILPTLHNEIEFSRLGAKLLQKHKIDQLLVELPQEIRKTLLTAIDRLPIPTVVHNGDLNQLDDKTLIPHPSSAYIVHPGESLYWTSFLARRSGIPVKFIDTWYENAYQTFQLPIGHPHLAAVGWTTFWKEGAAITQQHLEQNLHRYRSYQMQEFVVENLQPGKTLAVICGAAHWPAIVAGLRDKGFDISTSMIPVEIVDQYQQIIQNNEKPTPDQMPEWQLADIHPHTLHLVTGSLPFYLERLVEDPIGFDQMEAIRQLYFQAEQRYQQKFDDQVSTSSYQRLFQYLRNLGRTAGRIIPSLFDLIAAAKGMVDDDYAFEVYRVAIGYSFLPNDNQKLDNQLKFIPDEKQGRVIKFAFKRRIRRPILKKVDKDTEFEDLDPIPDEEYPGQWEEIWDRFSPYGYVSYPPEDEFIEQYLGYLRKRIIEILMEEQSSTMEFESSLEDGIDWRETMRHYHEGKIYVKKYPKNKFQVGALVIQFLEEPYDTQGYSSHTTLFAEHDQESHISIITTEPGEVLVGPGISRVKYAAIVSQFPPVGMPYLISKENIELKLRLIWTAMNMSLNKIIGFVAKKPPTAAQRHFAAEQGYRIVYLPMGQLTADSLRRLRTMHLLAHRDLRDNAREYIGF